MATYYPDGSVKTDWSIEQQPDGPREVVCVWYEGGWGRQRMMRYKDGQLDGGAEPARVEWYPNGEIKKQYWYTGGVLVRETRSAYLPDKNEKISRAENCAAIISACLFVGGLIAWVMTLG